MSIEKQLEELTGEVTNLTNAIHALIESQGSTPAATSPNETSDTAQDEKPSGGQKKKKTGGKKAGSKKTSSKKAGSDDDTGDDEGGDDKPQFTTKDVQTKLVAVGKRFHRPGIEEILAQFDVSNARELDESQYADVIAAADKKLAEE